MKTYGYVRVSTQEQAADDRSSLAIQERRIEGLAVASGRAIDRVFSDAGVSGSVPLSKRPAGAELWSLLAPGDTVIASKLDRLFRSASDALRTSEELHKRGVHLVLLDLGMEPVTQGGVAKFFFGVLALVAELERSTIQERMRGGALNKAAAGGHIGGCAPFGFAVEGRGRDARLVECPELLSARAKIVDLRAQGLSYRRISYALADVGIKASPKAVQKALARGVNGRPV